MAKQMQLFPAEQRQEDIINAPADAASLEGFPLNTSAEPVLDMNNIAEVDTDIVEETAVYPIKKEPIIFEPYDVANMNKLGIYGKELLEVFNLVQEEVAKKARDKAQVVYDKANALREAYGDMKDTMKEDIFGEGVSYIYIDDDTGKTKITSYYLKDSIVDELHLMELSSHENIDDIINEVSKKFEVK